MILARRDHRERKRTCRTDGMDAAGCSSWMGAAGGESYFGMVIVSMMKKYDMAAERCGEREANA